MLTRTDFEKVRSSTGWQVIMFLQCRNNHDAQTICYLRHQYTIYTVTLHLPI